MRPWIERCRRVSTPVLVVWLALVGALLGACTDGSARVVTVLALAAAALAGLLRDDWRESLAIGLGAAALSAWMVDGTLGEGGFIVVAFGVVLTAPLASACRPRPAEIADEPASDRAAAPSPADVRLPPGVADEALLDRLVVHEMTRARRYERPLTLLLIGVDGWPTLVADRGRHTCHELLTILAMRTRRLLRDVDAIGLHGDGQLAVLLPETPLDGASVVASRIQQVARADVGLETRIGIALFPDDAATVEGLVHEAEAGLDLARIEGVSVVQRVLVG